MSPWLGLLLVGLLIAANGLFVAAEFAFVAARREILRLAAERRDRRARTALRVSRRLGTMLSGAQFGITVTSLVVGFLAEASIGPLLEPLVERLGLPAASAGGAAVTIAFLVATAAQMVFGELVPKNLAVARPEPTALRVARPMSAYMAIFGPIIWVFDEAARRVTRWFGVEPAEELVRAVDDRTLARIITASARAGALTPLQSELLQRAIALSRRRVAEIMVGRPDVVWLDAAAPVAELRRTARRTGFSRFPVRGRDEDEVLGTVHIKDLLRVPAHAVERTTVGDLVTPAVFVPEGETLRQFLDDLRQHQRTFAVVVDEYGSVAGIATIEDAVEALVGDIRDEFDAATGTVRPAGRGRFHVAGQVRVDRLSEILGVALPEGPYETAAGLVLERLGRIPEVGERIQVDGWWLTVTRVEGHRIVELLVEQEGSP